MNTPASPKLRTDLTYESIAGITAATSNTWTIVGQPDHIAWVQHNDSLGYYFADGCVDGYAALLDANQDRTLLTNLDDRLKQWMDDPARQAGLLVGQGDIVIGRYPLKGERFLWVVAESGGTYLYEEVAGVLFKDGAIATYIGDHMELDCKEHVVGLAKAPHIWEAVIELGTKPQP